MDTIIDDVSNRNKPRKFAIPQRDIDISIKASKVVGIPACEKEKILWELDCLGINKATLFPELEPHVTDIVRKLPSLTASVAVLGKNELTLINEPELTKIAQVH